MYVENVVHAFGGLLVAAGVVLGRYVNEWFLLVPLFIGLNFFQYGFSNFCPLAAILKKLGMKSCFDAAGGGK